MATTRILIVDDDPAVRAFLGDVLATSDRQVVTAENGEDALACIAGEEYDLVLLDLKMKGLDGLAVLRELQELWPDTAVIVLTGHASLETAIEALRRGAHDYLFKPCATVTLRESVRTALRERRRRVEERALLSVLKGSQGEGLSQPDALEEGQITRALPLAFQDWQEGRFVRHGGLIVDLARHTVLLEGHLLQFSPTEFDLLAYLASEAPRVVSPQELVRAVQGYECTLGEAASLARSHIYHIRQKVEAATGRRDVIRTVRGPGYAIEALAR